MASHPLLQLEEPVIHLDGTLYAAGGQGADRDNSREGGARLIYKGHSFPLEPIGPASALDLLHIKRQASAFEAYKSGFIQEVRRTELHSRGDILHGICSNQLVELIVGRVLPKLTGEDVENKLDRLLRAQQPPHAQQQATPPRTPSGTAHHGTPHQGTARETPTPLTRPDAPRRTRGRTRRDRADDADEAGSIASEVIQALAISNPMTQTGERTLAGLIGRGYTSIDGILTSPDFLKMDHQIHTLLEAKQHILTQLSPPYITSNSQAVFSARRIIREVSPGAPVERYIQAIMQTSVSNKDTIIQGINGLAVASAGRTYIPSFACQESVLNGALEARFHELLKVEAAYQFEEQLQDVSRRSALESRFRDIIDRTEYERNNAGFKKTHDGYYVFMDTGPYEIKHDRSTYRFPSARVGVHLSGSGTSIRIQPPVVLNTYKHPFLQSHTHCQRICLGQFDISTFSPLALEERIVAIVSKGAEVLKFGYRQTARPYRFLTSPEFDEYRAGGRR